MQQEFEKKWREYFGEEKWLNIKANEALSLADKNVATEKAASEKDEAEAETAKELHAESSAESKAVCITEKDEVEAEAAKEMHTDSSAESMYVAQMLDPLRITLPKKNRLCVLS